MGRIGLVTAVSKQEKKKRPASLVAAAAGSAVKAAEESATASGGASHSLVQMLSLLLTHTHMHLTSSVCAQYIENVSLLPAPLLNGFFLWQLLL